MKEGERLTSPVSAAEEPIVFVIDDDPLMLGGLSSLFRSIGLRVEAFASATELLQHPLSAVPSCLVLDIRLPRLSGFDLQAELNRLYQAAETLTHWRHRLRGAKDAYPIGPPYVSAIDVPERAPAT